MEVLRDQNGNYPVDKSINDNLFSDEVQIYDRVHRNSADSSSSERTLYVDPRSAFESSIYANNLDFFSYLDLQDAFRSSIYDKPEVRTCDCATKFALKNNCNNDEMSENQNKPTKSEPQQEPSQSQPPQNSIYTYNEVYLLFIFVSVISYVIGYFGLTSVWLLIILYQSIKWYINVNKDHKERVRWEVSREMSIDKLRRDNGESVEWLNYLLQQIWRTFDPSLLIGLRDMFEDVMARSAPSFIVATDIESFEIGIIAPRIENIKILPRCEDQDDEDVVVGEATFSFRASSSPTTRNEAPPHILAWIKTGISAVIPIKVELIGFKASINFEIKITGTSPFISTGKFSFLESPLYETSIMPLIPMNITQFPIIKEFIHSTVETVLKQFTRPNYIDLDLGQLLMGDDLLHDTQAIGIMRVDIIEARNLTHVDISGENDPYVISSLDPSPYMHTHSTTRVIEDCANPVWKETFFHKIPDLDMLDEHIRFRLKVMDWDRFTADDHIGSIWFDIKDSIGNGEREILIHDGWKKIKINPNDTVTHGELNFRLIYYPKLPNNVEAKPDQTSGIFGLKIHQAINLQITTAPYIEESIMMSDNHYNASFPNPYAVVYINDSRVFRTRAKLNNVAPFWNASTEQVVRDWKNAIVRVVIKDQKDLEYDPVIGMVTLSMNELFDKNEKKEETKWYPLRHGIGYGKVRLSFLLKPVSMVLSPEEKGYDVGTLLVHSIVAEGLDNQYAGRSVYLTLTIRNTEIEQATKVSNSFPPRWLEQTSSNDGENRMEFAVFRRYRTSLIITVYRKGLLGIYQNAGMAEFWLRDVKDGCETEVQIPIFENLPKCFPPSESQLINLDDIPRCDSPVQDPETITEDVESLHDSDLVTQERMPEKVIEKDQSIIDSTDLIPPEEVGESSQNIQRSDEKCERKDVIELNSPKPNTNDEISIINNNNDTNDTNETNNMKETDKSSDQLPLKSTETSSEKSVLNTTETPSASDPSAKKSTINVSKKTTASEIPHNIPQKSSAIAENITSDAPKRFLRFNVRFKPGLSLVHEHDVERSLTGANVKILSQNPLEDVENQQKRLREQRRATDIYSENYETETGQRRINTVHRRRTMRQLQWVKDLVKAKVISMSGKREWEDEEIIEHEV